MRGRLSGVSVALVLCVSNLTVWLTTHSRSRYGGEMEEVVECSGMRMLFGDGSAAARNLRPRVHSAGRDAETPEGVCAVS